MNDVFERLSERLDNMLSCSDRMKEQLSKSSVQDMQAEHDARCADIDSWWEAICVKHAVAEAAMDAKHKEAQRASKQVKPASSSSSVCNNEEANRLFAEQHRLFMEQADRNHEQANRLFME